MRKLQIQDWRELERWRDGRTDVAHAASAVAVGVQREDQQCYSFRFRVRSASGDLRLAPRVSPQRCNELWRHTCFELFVMRPDGSYCEFNFSPSTQWAAYRFEDYRDAMTELSMDEAPHIETNVSAGLFVLDARVSLSSWINKEVAAQCRIALAAVVEAGDGRIEYWALTHRGERPDFHHKDSFIARLPDNVA